MISKFFACVALCLSSVAAYGQEAPVEASPSSTPISQQSNTTSPALTISQSEPEKSSVRSLYTTSAVMTGLWAGGLAATIPFAERADANFNFGDDPGPVDESAVASGFAVNTAAKLALNGAMLSFGLARYEKTQKARPLYLLAGASLVNVAARSLALELYAGEGSLLGPNPPSDEGIYVPAYTMGIASALALTTYATVKAARHTKAKRKLEACSEVASK